MSWLMGILNLVYRYSFLFVSLAVIQEIYIEMVFCKESMLVPLSSFPWILASPESGQSIYDISFMFRSVNLSILQKTITKTIKSPHAFAMCSIRTDLIKQEHEKMKKYWKFNLHLCQEQLRNVRVTQFSSCFSWDDWYCVSYTSYTRINYTCF